jgi:hypothetical protein
MDDTDWSDISFETPKQRPPALTSYQALNHLRSEIAQDLAHVPAETGAVISKAIAEYIAALPTEIRPKRGGWPKGKPRKATE